MATLPVLIALTLAILSYVVKNWKHSNFVVLSGSATQIALASWFIFLTSEGQTLQTSVGGWLPPFGISFYIDTFSALMLWISSFLFFVVQLYSLASPESNNRFWAHNACWNLLAAGVYGTFATNDLFNLFVWFEVLLLSSYVLFSWSFTDDSTELDEQRKSRKGLITYITLNIIGSSIFLFGLALLYSSTGTLNFSDIIRLTQENTSSTISLSGFCLIFAFAMKAGLFPLFNWLPASYPVGPISSVALFAGLLTKIGIYALVRFFIPTSPLSSEWIFPTMMVSANLTMLLGVYGAATHQSLRTILSFHIISQVGYMGLGFAIGTVTSLSATIFYLLHHMVVKTNLFLIAGAVMKVRKTDELKNLGGVVKTNPWLATAFAISALSLAGIPPFSGFWAKFFILYSALQSGAYWGLFIGLFVGLFTLFSMLKIWNEAFLKPSPAESHGLKVPRVYTVAILLLTIWTIVLGCFPSALTTISDFASGQLTDPILYLRTLEGGPK